MGRLVLLPSTPRGMHLPRTRASLLRTLLLLFLLSFTIFTTVEHIHSQSVQRLPTAFPPPYTIPSTSTPTAHTPTDPTSPDSNPLVRLPPPPETPFRSINWLTHDIDGPRYRYLSDLGSGGCEGFARVYFDATRGEPVVIKTFYRNVRTGPLPAHLLPVFNPHWDRWRGWYRYTLGAVRDGTWGGITTWPAELPAALWYARNPAATTVLDYFYVANRRGGWNWQLVAPLYSAGTLETLAAATRRRQLPVDEVDALYRPAFEEYLAALDALHADGFCHNDIKADNIFLLPRPANNSTQWLLADLGNVREHAHLFHSVRARHPSPRRVPPQRHDCITVDLERALRTYLGFLRDAAAERDEFDAAFYAARRPWSWMYWEWMAGRGGEGVRGVLGVMRSERGRPRDGEVGWEEEEREEVDARVRRRIDVELDPIAKVGA